MIKTNNGSFLLRLEQKVLESINLYVDSGEQFLNIPDREVFDDEFVKFKAKNIQNLEINSLIFRKRVYSRLTQCESGWGTEVRKLYSAFLMTSSTV